MQRLLELMSWDARRREKKSSQEAFPSSSSTSIVHEQESKLLVPEEVSSFLVIALGLAQQQFWAPSRGSRAQVGASQQEQRSCEQHQGCVLRVTSSPCRQHCLIVSLCSSLRAAKSPGLAQSSTNCAKAAAAATLDLHPAADLYCHISLQSAKLKLAVLCLPVLQPFLQLQRSYRLCLASWASFYLSLLFLPSSFHTDHSTSHVLT